MEPKQAQPLQERVSEIAEESGPWRWSRLRSLGFGVSFWPLEWGLGTYRSDDKWGGMMSVAIGPLELTMHYNDGSAMQARA